MNLILSMLLFNPLEALCVFMFCNIFNNRKININEGVLIYIFGIISCVIQYPTIFISNMILQLFLDIIICLIIMPILLYLFYKAFISKDISLLICFLSFLFCFLTIMIISYLIGFLIPNFYFSSFSVLTNEVIANGLVRLFQFTFIFIIKGIKNMNVKKTLKEMSKKSTEKAFTVMKVYHPKMPKILSKKIDEKKD